MATTIDPDIATHRIGYACSYVPQEIILAAGLRPWRIVPHANPGEADAAIHATTCFYVKSLLATALEGGGAAAAGMIVANSCDGMRRLYDIWRAYVPDTPAFYLDVPKRRDGEAVAFFASELGRLVAALNDAFPEHGITADRLERAIVRCNDLRRQMGTIAGLVSAAKPRLRGSDFFDITLEAGDATPDEMRDHVARLLTRAAEGNGSHSGPRVVVSGNMVNNRDVLTLIEDLDARIVGLDTCFGLRQFDLPVEEHTGNPLEALARRYLLRAPCARMEDGHRRVAYLKGLVERCKAEAVIYSTVKFCDTHLYDLPLLSESFRQAGTPFLAIENDYLWTGMGQVRTRVEAFLEMVRQGGV